MMLDQLFFAQRTEDDDVVDAVQELGLEMRACNSVHDLLGSFFEFFIACDSTFALQKRGADVRRHDQDRVLEIDDAAFAVGEAAVVHDLQENVEDVGMRFFDFVEQHDRIGTAANLLGELSAFFIADIARRRADQARDGMLLHVFRHVDAEHGVLVVEQKFGESAGQFGFADASGAEKNKGADRALGIAESGAGTANGVGHALQRCVLADNALAQALFHRDQLFDFAFEHFRDRNSGPLGDDARRHLLRRLLPSACACRPGFPSACSAWRVPVPPARIRP